MTVFTLVLWCNFYKCLHVDTFEKLVRYFLDFMSQNPHAQSHNNNILQSWAASLQIVKRAKTVWSRRPNLLPIMLALAVSNETFWQKGVNNIWKYKKKYLLLIINTHFFLLPNNFRVTILCLQQMVVECWRDWRSFTSGCWCVLTLLGVASKES